MGKKILFFILFSVSSAFAQDLSITPSKNEIRGMAEWNRLRADEFKQKTSHQSLANQNEKNFRPYAEYEQAQYLIFDSKVNFESASIKEEMAKNLPADVELVILAQPDESATRLQELYGKWIEPKRLHILPVKKRDNTFWARDVMPIPVLENFTNKLSLVHTTYFRQFESQELIAKYFQASLREINYYFEGGNLMVDKKGRCFIINNIHHSQIPDEIFYDSFGCRSVTRLPHLTGMGHIDERLKLISDTEAVTDTEDYEQPLQDLGFHITRLPTPTGKMESYANSLLINGTLFLPVFDEPTDAQAIAIYKSFGLNVVPIKAVSLPNNGMGSIHCITMTYPPAPLGEAVVSLAH